MKRKRMTELFPGLLPLRKRQRVFCFYAGMSLDGNVYAKERKIDDLPWVQYSGFSLLYNQQTGFDMKYQENKVFNLRLAAKKLDGLLIAPGETFSFWKAVRYADREVPYKDGLTVVNGKVAASPGGGLCQMSNLLFELFLHSPLEITERKGHEKKEFPDTHNSLEGVDATVSEGWTDLKVKNKTGQTFQIRIVFDEKRIFGILRTDHRPEVFYKIRNEHLVYQRRDGRVYQRVSVYRDEVAENGEPRGRTRLLYENCCEIGYELPAGVEIKEEMGK